MRIGIAVHVHWLRDDDVPLQGSTTPFSVPQFLCG